MRLVLLQLKRKNYDQSITSETVPEKLFERLATPGPTVALAKVGCTLRKIGDAALFHRLEMKRGWARFAPSFESWV